MSEGSKEVAIWRNKASEIVVANATDMQMAEGVLTELRRRKKTWLDAVEKTVKTAHAAWKEAVAHRDSVAKPIEEAEKILKSKIAEYVFTERKKADEERRRLQAEADAKAEAERKRALAAAAKLKTDELREQRQAEAEMIVAPVIDVAPAVPETKLATVVTYGFEIIDAAAIPAEYMIPDEKKIGAVVRATKGSIAIPGVKIIKRESVR